MTISEGINFERAVIEILFERPGSSQKVPIK